MTDPVPTALIGCGRWGRNHARTLAQLGALAAVCDADAQAAETFAEEHGARARSVDEVMSDPDVPGVVLALPAQHHASLAVRALAAGKHVMVEKPMALRTVDAQAMVDAAKTARRVLMTGHVLRYHPAFGAIRDAIAAGRIGAVRHIQSTRLGFGRFYDRFDAMWDLAPHDLSLVLSIADRSPASVASQTVSTTGWQTDTAHIHMAFADGGPSAHVHVSRHWPAAERRFVVTGETGSLVWDDLADAPSKVVLVGHAAERPADGDWQWSTKEPEPIPVGDAMPLTEELSHFLDCARSGRTPLTPGTQGLEVVRILEKASA